MSELTRMTINLTARSKEDLDRAVVLTRDSQTDVINDAIRLYAYFRAMEQTGADFRIMNDDGTLERIILL